jgi:hypothetical protein
MIAITFFNANSRIYSPVQRCLRKMNSAEKHDYASQLSDYVLSVSERKFQNRNLVEI